MPELVPVREPGVEALEHEVFSRLGCKSHGIVVLHGATSWEARERGFVELPSEGASQRIGIAHDEREAPFAIDADGREMGDLLLSLTDEDEYIACAWAQVDDGSPLLGVGVDLCATSHFQPRKSGRELDRLLLSAHELELAGSLAPDNPLYARSVLFAAKEAAFKATAAPLRRWDDHHDERLRFEVRHFVMEQPGVERGTGRNGAAQRAMDAMGIRRVLVHHALVCDMALVVAVALG